MIYNKQLRITLMKSSLKQDLVVVFGFRCLINSKKGCRKLIIIGPLEKENILTSCNKIVKVSKTKSVVACLDFKLLERDFSQIFLS